MQDNFSNPNKPHIRIDALHQSLAFTPKLNFPPDSKGQNYEKHGKELLNQFKNAFKSQPEDR